MKPTGKHVSIFTGLLKPDKVKLDSIARAKGVTLSEAAREALLQYIERHEGQEDPNVADELKRVANRICGLLFKIGLDTHSVARFIWERGDDEEKDLFDECYAKASKYMHNRLTPEEREAVSRMTD